MGGCRATSARHRARRALTGAQRCRDERGVAAIEFALVLPLLVMLLFGVTTAGLAYNDNLSIANAAREGARLGAALDYQAAGGSTWASSVQQRVQQVYFNSSNTLTDSEVCVELKTASGTVLASNGNTGCGTEPTLPTMVAGSCAVVVWVQKVSSISLIVFPDYTFNIGASSVDQYGLTDQQAPQTCTTQ